MPFLHTTSDVSTFNIFWFVAVRSFTADSSLLQPTASVNTTPHTSHFFADLYAHAWFKSCVWRAHITCHVSSSCAYVVVLTLRDFSTFLSLLSIFSLIINFIFHDVVDKFPVHSSWWGPVSRTTHTNLDVMQESRIDDYWNIDGSRDLSDYWTGFTQFTLLEEKSPDGYMWSGWRLTWRQVTSRPDHLWPELWTKLGRNAELREKQKWSIEKSKLGNARRSRGIYFIDPKDKEFKETNRNARKKLETPMAPAAPCKTCKKSKHGETRVKTNEFKSKLACILEASESTRLRVGESLPNHHENHIAGKGDNSLQHYNFGTHIYSYASSHEDSRSKSSSG